MLLWAPVPTDLAAQVKGGYESEDSEEMWGDVVQEITPDGEVIYEWKSWEFLDVDEDVICPMEGRHEWSHQNALNITSDGDLLVSYRQTSTVGIVDKASGQFKWKWGPGQVNHQHHPTWLPNGRVMIFDNGCHRRGPAVPASSRLTRKPTKSAGNIPARRTFPFSATTSAAPSGSPTATRSSARERRAASSR